MKSDKEYQSIKEDPKDQAYSYNSSNTRRKIIKEEIVIDKDQALQSIYNSLFKKGRPNFEYLNDENIFQEMEDGLSNKEVTWLRQKRDQILEREDNI
mmetsp:Transcript_15041/g.13200  ORF Transcript_15041/g.13200 Transcript_15041/m.13200 type:complete len:97 (+) Transcript_15041:363-653(+)